MNSKILATLALCLVAGAMFTGCEPDEEITPQGAPTPTPEPPVTFAFRFGSDAEEAACNPDAGGTKEACLQVPLEALFGIAHTKGIGRRGDAGLKVADCVVEQHGFYDNGKGPTPSYHLYVRGVWILKAQYGRFSREENNARNQLGIATKLKELIETDQCRFP